MDKMVLVRMNQFSVESETREWRVYPPRYVTEGNPPLVPHTYTHYAIVTSHPRPPQKKKT